MSRILRMDPEHRLAKECADLSAEQSPLRQWEASLEERVKQAAPPPTAGAAAEPEDRAYHLTSRESDPHRQPVAVYTLVETAFVLNP
jgi:hypothetical protein